MAEVQITFQDMEAGGKAIKMISFVGQLDETNVDEEAKKIYQIIDEMTEPNLLLDFSELAYMNSKSIGYVTDWYSKVVAKNGKIVIASPKPNILDILKVVGITQIVNIYDSIDAAKQVLGSGSTEAPAPTASAETSAPATPVPAPTPAPEAPVAEPAPTPEAPATPAETPVAEAPEAPAVEVPAEEPVAVAVPAAPVAEAPAPTEAPTTLEALETPAEAPPTPPPAV